MPPAPPFSESGRSQGGDLPSPEAEARRHRWNIYSLYSAMFVNAVVNLLLIGYLARVLEPEAWGTVLLAQGLGYWLCLIPDYGFSFSAGRAIAQARGSDEAARIAYSVTASKLLLSVGIAPACAIAYFAIGRFQAEPLMLLGAGLFAFAQGLDPIWLFQGRERQVLYALITSTSRIGVLLATYLLVHGAEDSWIVMLLHTAGAMMIFFGGIWFLRVSLPRAPVSAASIAQSLRKGWKVFQFRAAQNLNGTGLLILGAVAPAALDVFGSADRIVRNVLGLLGPISGAGMPRIARLLGTDASAAKRLARLNFFIMVGFATVAAAGLIVLAPIIVRLLLGPGYDAVIPVLRLASLALPMAAASSMLSIQWMLPLGRDKALVAVALASALVTISAFPILASLYGAMGATFAMLAAEAAALTGCVIALRWKGGRPAVPDQAATAAAVNNDPGASASSGAF